MPQNRRQIKLTIILLLTIIFISQFFLISLAKTEVYFFLYDDPETVIIENIRKAEISIDIAMYTFTDKEISQFDYSIFRGVRTTLGSRQDNCSENN